MAFREPRMSNSFCTNSLVWPWINRTTGEFVTAGTYKAPEKYHYLYRHLRETGCIIEVPYFNQKLLFQTPRDIVRMIKTGDEHWCEYVPETARRLVERWSEPEPRDQTTYAL